MSGSKFAPTLAKAAATVLLSSELRRLWFARRLSPPSRIFRPIENSGTIKTSCGTTVMPSRDASLGRVTTTQLSPTKKSPSSAACTPLRILMSVDLPAPFSPSKAWISPRFRSRSTPSSAVTPGNRFLIPRRRSAKAPGAFGMFIYGPSKTGLPFAEVIGRCRRAFPRRHRRPDAILQEPRRRA